MIGSGIYVLPATLGKIGSVTVLGWVISGLGAMLLASVFVLLCRLRPTSVGMIHQIKDGVGRFFGFHASLLYWVGGWIGNVAIALAATGYLSVFFPILEDRAPRGLCTVAVIWLMLMVNLTGPRRVADFQTVTLLIGLIPVVGVAVLGWYAFDPAVFVNSWNVTGKSDLQVIPESLALIFWAFVGLESASVAAAVVSNPVRNVPVATLGGVLTAVVVYTAASAVLSGVMPAAALAQSAAPFADVTARWIGPAAALLVAGCAVLKALGTLSGWLLVTTEGPRSGAASGVFPRLFQEDGHGVPRRNLYIVASLMTMIVVLSSVVPTLEAAFTRLINLATLLYLVIYIYCCAGLWRVTPHWGARGVAVLAGLFCGWAVYASDTQQLLLLSLITVLTGLLYRTSRRGRPAR